MFQARIMAAKERSQQAQTKASPRKQAPADLLMDFDAPATEKDPPPPSYDTNFLQPPPPAAAAMAPPAFDIVENSMMQQMNFPPPPPIDAIDAFAPPPRMMGAYESPAASAPSFEDLLDSQQNQQTHNPLAGMQAVPPPAAPPAIDEDILAALDPAERKELLEEQEKIMAQIEKEKASNSNQPPMSAAAARAMAFNQRSSNAVAQVAGALEAPRRSAPTRPATSSRSNHGGQTVDLGAGEQVPLHGQERTQQAIKDGTALVVQCMSCQNWMQVTESASLMFCPVCQTVSPVDKAGAATSADMEAAAQLAADAELAERLQNEEYGAAGDVPAEARTRRPKSKPQQPKAGEEGQSWYNWFVGTPEEKAAATTPTHGSAEIRRSPALISAHTGAEEGVGRSRSYDEGEGLLGAGGGGGGARVAEQKSMFACVADSISTAATQMTAYNTDEEGNVHGVDSSSLLVAMPDVSRQRET
jgi:hypothetical protein